jgi:hypothetical protein
MKSINWMWVGIFMLLGVAVASAAEAVAPGAAPVVTSIWSKIGMGALGGVIAAFVGWMKNKDIKTTGQEPFGLNFLVSTVIVGAIAGAVGAWQGFATVIDTMNWAEQSMMWGAIAAGGEMLLKAIWRQGAPHLIDIINVFKSGAGNPTPPTPPAPSKPS